MVLTIIALNSNEEFLQFLDPELCTLVETHEKGGLRTCEFTYTFQEYGTDKDLFKIGNKIWIQGDNNLTDCLYVINTQVTTDIYQENTFTVDLEEVLVELNYAPLVSQTEITAANGFNLVNENNADKYRLNWNALNYFFGDYFNIGVCQCCINTHADKLSLTGTINRMNLLRQIEEETGNVFVTRYEKDILNNTIHRYIDFLNPNNNDKDWEVNWEYNFITQNNGVWYDSNNEETTPDQPEQLIPYDSSGDPLTNEYTAEDDNLDDIDAKKYTPISNLDPDNTDFRIVDQDGNLLDADMNICDIDDDNALRWKGEDISFTDDNDVVIRLMKNKTKLSLDINNKSYVVVGIGDYEKCYISSYTTIADETLATNTKYGINLKDDVCFEIYDYVNEQSLFRTALNTSIGHTHEEILDFGFNVDNIVYEVDETEVFTSIAPELQLDDSANSLTRHDLATIINRWKNLTIAKNTKIPLTLEKINVEASSLENAKRSLGSYTNNSGANVSNSVANYWRRPLKPNDNTDSTDKTYEFWRGTSYFYAPFVKHKGFTIRNPSIYNLEYREIHGKQDARTEKGIQYDKQGYVESNEEDPYAIYLAVINYLKEHQVRKFNISVDVANLRKGQFNQYQLHDKVYLKLPDTGELVTARVTKTNKEAHDIAKNSIELDNYSLFNVRFIQHETYIEANSTSWSWPLTKTVTVRLVNDEYDSTDPDSIHYPANKLITFNIYEMDNQNREYKKTYTRLTDSNGKVKLPLKLNVGNYEMDIMYGGDEEYLETNQTIKLNVNGTVNEPTNLSKKKSATKQKTTKKTSKKKKTKNTNQEINKDGIVQILGNKLNKLEFQRTMDKSSVASQTANNISKIVQPVLTKTQKKVKKYWNKCGRSPDGKQIVSIAKPSGPDANKYSYRLYKTVFKNYCPICKKSGTLAFDGGKKNKCIKSAGAYGRGYKLNIPEHEITCNACDSDFCGVTGIEKWNPVRGRLTTIEKPVKSSETEFNQLVKGKLVHSVQIKTIKKKVVTQTKTKRRTIKGNPSYFIRQKALDIVGNSTGLTALQKIADFMDDKNNVRYKGYGGFHRTPRMVIELGSGNCCDQTRCFMELCDAAGLTEYFDFCYVHVHEFNGHVYAKVTQKWNGKWAYFDCASDTHGCWGYVCQGYSHGSCASTYPTLPF